jgi:hypothetical protein
MIAALLSLSAAICAAAQSRANEKRSTPEPQTNAPATPKHNTREPQTKPETASPSSSPKLESDADSITYSYEFTKPEFFLSRVFIEHDANGRGKITFERKFNDPVIDPVELSPAAIARIKALWDALRFLDSDKSYQSDKDYPHLGTTRLRMKQGTRDRLAEFNWTGDKDAFALVNEYKRAANQAILIFDLELARENQPLEAPKLMTQFDTYLRRNELSDPQQLVPLLRDLSTDERIPLMARNHAGRLLKKIEK